MQSAIREMEDEDDHDAAEEARLKRSTHYSLSVGGDDQNKNIERCHLM